MRAKIPKLEWTQTPNVLFDLMPVISDAEKIIAFALARETYGWQRQEIEMSIGSFMLATGMSKQGCINGIERLLCRDISGQITKQNGHKGRGLILRRPIPVGYRNPRTKLVFQGGEGWLYRFNREDDEIEKFTPFNASKSTTLMEYIENEAKRQARRQPPVNVVDTQQAAGSQPGLQGSVNYVDSQARAGSQPGGQPPANVVDSDQGASADGADSSDGAKKDSNKDSNTGERKGARARSRARKWPAELEAHKVRMMEHHGERLGKTTKLGGHALACYQMLSDYVPELPVERRVEIFLKAYDDLWKKDTKELFTGWLWVQSRFPQWWSKNKSSLASLRAGARSADNAAPLPAAPDADLLESFKAGLRARMNKDSFDEWVRPVSAACAQNGTLHVSVPTKTHADWLTANYFDLIEETLADIGRPDAMVQFHYE